MGCCGSRNEVDSTIPVQKPEDLPTYDKANAPFASADGTMESAIRFAKDGIASEKGCPATTVGALFRLAAGKHADKRALAVERPLPAFDKKTKKAPPALPLDQWKQWTWQQYLDDCSKIAKYFISLGCQQHDAVSIFGFNSPEWFIAEMGAILGGFKAAGIYPTDTPEQVAYKSRHSGAAVACVEDASKLKKYVDQIEELPALKAIVCWACEAPAEGEIKRQDGTSVQVVTWEQALALGDKVDNKELEDREAQIKPGHCCTLIYTSGTTGQPKAVMISHDNIIFESTCVTHILKGTLGDRGQAERIISYLPLSHVAGMMVDIITPVVCGARLSGWMEVYFARPYDLKVGTLGERLRAIKPTLFLGVPRVWEKIAEKMKAIGASTTGLKKSVATWAKNKGLKAQEDRQLGGSGAVPCCYGRADSMVLSKVKLALGLEECVFGFTGAAPIQKATLEYFGALGIQINEVYGMSECTGATTWSTDRAHVWGSCGWEMPGTEVKCFIVDEKSQDMKECPRADDIFNPSEPEQGEICFRGRHIMMGYLANPDLGDEHVALLQKKTAESIDGEGWLHSGDKGCIGKNGMVRITGRYKELIIGAGGENIAPVPIENAIQKMIDGVSNVMMVGDKRKFNVCCVTLKVKGYSGDSPGTDELDGAACLVDEKAKTVGDAMKSKAWEKYIFDAIVAVNKDAPNNASKIQKFTILPVDFSVSGDELTPTLKLKRSVVVKKYLAMIDSMYDCKDAYVPFKNL